MYRRVPGVPIAALLLISARLVAANCTKDDPDGARVLAARAQVQSECPCDQNDPPAFNHGAYVACAANIANVRAALDPSDPDFLPRTCKGAVKKCAAKSVCGKPNFVTCCITKANGQIRCRTRKATSCAARNGIAGACTSCCDACPAPGSGPSCPAPTTTTTTIAEASSTTTTIPPGSVLQFTTVPGTTSCGSAGLSTSPSPPLSGEVDSDTAGTTKIVDLGLGCLYLGGGSATIVPPGRVPDGSTTLYAITGPGTLAGSSGTSPDDCSVGAGPGTHCVNNNSMPACSSDGNCGGTAGACALDANCYDGPPLPIMSPPPFQSISSCVVNVIQTDASGTFDANTGAASVSMSLSSRVYITGNSASPCPKCLSGTCDPTWKTHTSATSPDTAGACTAVGSLQTSRECRPSLPAFQAGVPIDLMPFTTGTTSATAGDGNFCPSQSNAGAFGQLGVQRIAETGSPAGDITDGLPHGAALASVVCVPQTGNPAIDAILDLPGPGAISVNGNLQTVTITTTPTTTTTTTMTTSTTTPIATTTTSTTTTTTVIGPTTTTTVPGPALKFSSVAGTTSCGNAGLSTSPSSPFSGEVDSDTAGTTKIVDLGLGCLYLGGGNATIVPPVRVPDGFTTLYAITGPGTLGGSAGTSAKDCSVGAGPGKHCVNNNSMPTCSNDGGCGGAASACALDANCYLGPPLPILSPPPFNALSSCLVNVVETAASGTFDAATGAASVSLPLSTRVYITSNTASPCPKCLSGVCDPTWKTNTSTTSPDTGAPCTPGGSSLTSQDCRPDLARFQGGLPIGLMLTTGAASATAADGNFCPSQSNAGAFGQVGAQRIAESGSPAGDITDGLPHGAALASVVCVPPTGNAATDAVIDLPGPGAISVNGDLQMIP